MNLFPHRSIGINSGRETFGYLSAAAFYRSVVCPHCNAPVGEYCRTLTLHGTGVTGVNAHSTRKSAALRTVNAVATDRADMLQSGRTLDQLLADAGVIPV